MQDINEQLYDIYTEWHVPFWQTSWFLTLSTIIVGLFVFYILWRLWLHFVSKKSELAYHIVARNNLIQLKSSEYACCAHAALFYAQLIAIIKKYLSVHFDSDFASKTDHECLALLASVARNKELYAIVAQLLNGSMAVRFARESAIEKIIQDDLNRALEVITVTQLAQKEPSGGTRA